MKTLTYLELINLETVIQYIKCYLDLVTDYLFEQVFGTLLVSNHS